MKGLLFRIIYAILISVLTWFCLVRIITGIWYSPPHSDSQQDPDNNKKLDKTLV